MRVIAGEARSLRLAYPKGVDIRPTTDAVRESLFASLGERVIGARFADLYAGSGSVGIEALSRGALQCVFIERDRRCLAALRANLRTTHLAGRAMVRPGTVEREWSAVARAYGPFDIVFADPPYGLTSLWVLVRRLLEDGEGVAENGLVVVQCEGCAPGVCDIAPSRVKRFGETEIRLYERRRE